MKKSPRYPPELIQKIKDALSISQIVGEHVVLRKQGSSSVGLCPFHSERSPSFTVNEDKRLYYCHGCKAGGDLVHFVMEMHGLSFFEAVTDLADRAQISLPNLGGDLSDVDSKRNAEIALKKSQGFKLNYFTAQFFRKELSASLSAQKYLQSRENSANADKANQISAEDLERTFYLGYAPSGWDALTRYLKNAKAPLDLAAEIGLIHPSKNQALRSNDVGYFDFFRNRIVFPILDLKGKVAGFGGRAMEAEEKPKYLNSSESFLYQKNKLAYGLFQARKFAHEKNELIMVEGYFDVLALYRAGIQNVAAVCGTRLSSEHLRIFSKFTDKIVILYDGDRAGQEAMDHAMRVGLENGKVVYGAFLPEGLDPDDYLKKYSAQDLRALIDQAQPLVDLKISKSIELAQKNTEEKSIAVKELGALLGTFQDPIGRQVRVKQVAESLGVGVHLLQGASSKSEGSSSLLVARPPAPPRPTVDRGSKSAPEIMLHEKVALQALIQWDLFAETWKKFYVKFPPKLALWEAFTTVPSKNLTKFLTIDSEKRPVSPFDPSFSSHLQDRLKLAFPLVQNPQVRTAIAEVWLEAQDAPNTLNQLEVEHALDKLLRRAWAYSSQGVRIALVEAESQKDSILQEKLLKEYLDVQRKIKELDHFYDQIKQL
jgi:DNA primase